MINILFVYLYYHENMNSKIWISFVGLFAIATYSYSQNKANDHEPITTKPTSINLSAFIDEALNLKDK